MSETGPETENLHMQNAFEILGLTPAFEIDLQKLDEAYFARQAVAHPDRFIHHSLAERNAATHHSSLLNQAYENLKNPVSRVKTLFRIYGIEAAGGNENEEGQTLQDPEILSEIMDLQERVEEAASPHDFKVLEAELQSCMNEIMAAFTQKFPQDYLSGVPLTEPAPLTEPIRHELAKLYVRFGYFAKMKRDLKNKLRQSSIKIL